MEFRKVNNDLKKKKMRIFSIFVFIVGSILTIYGFIVYFANYNVNMKFNDKSLDFFEGETLYFSGDVNIEYIYNGFKIYVNNKRQKSNEFTLKQGNYSIVLKKFFTKYIVSVNVDYSPSVFFEDSEGNMIHNYLSNSKPFKIKVDDISIPILVNEEVYEGKELTENKSYNINVLGTNYNINILKR